MSDNKINTLIDEEHIKDFVFNFKNKNIEIRLVGGSIRDALINEKLEI